MSTSSRKPTSSGRASNGAARHDAATDAELVAELGRRALAQSNMEILLGDAMRLIAERLDTEFVKVLELVPGGEGFLLTAGIGWQPGYVGQVVVPLVPESHAGYTMAEGHSVVVEDLPHEKRFCGMPLLHEHGIISGVSTVLRGRDRTHGILTANSARKRKFSEEDIAFFDSVGEIVAAALDRRDTEALLEESNRRLLLALDAGRLGAWEWNPHSGEVVWSDSVATTYGLAPGEFAGTVEAYLELTYPADRERVGNAIASALDGGRLEMEYRIVRSDGDVRWLSSRGLVIRDQRGQPVRMIGVCSDVTEEKAAERALREAEEKYRTLFENAAFGVFQTTIDGRFITANEALARILGYESPQQLIDEVQDIGTQVRTDPSRSAEFVRLLAESDEVSGFESQARRRDGTPIWISLTASARRNPSGELLNFEGIVDDITDSKLTQIRLATDERRQAFLAQAYAVLSSSLDYETTLASVARLCVPFLGDWCAVDIEEAERMRRVAVVHSDPEKVEYAERLRERYASYSPDNSRLYEAYKTGVPLHISRITDEMVRQQSMDDEMAELILALGLRSLIMVPLKATGRVIGMLSLATAESERSFTDTDLALAEELGQRAGLAVENARLYGQSQAIQEELRRANEAKDEFLGLVSHELRTPITTIFGGARLLRMRGDSLDSESRTEVLADIEHEAERLHRIVEDLLVLARMELGDELLTEPIMLPRIIEKTVGLLNRRRPGRQIEVRADAAMPPARASATYVEQTLRNLINNADKYSPPEDPIDVAAWKSADEIIVSVSDRGPGIPPEEMGRIFERFYRSPRTAKQAQGAGIGLTVCQRLIEAQGGRIWAEQRDGGGLTVSFSLPIYEDRPE